MKTTTTNPVLFERELGLELGERRLERALHEPRDVDALTWSLFRSLDTHSDRDWLAHRLQILGGPDLRPPVRIALFSGRDRGPALAPSPAYVAAVRERMTRAGAEGDALAESLREFSAPVEVPVRIESPDVLCLVDTCLERPPAGSGGSDRVLELVDVGLEAARRVGKRLAVAVVYPSGTEVAQQLSARIRALQEPGRLAAELPHRDRRPEVVLRELSWQRLVKVWEAERDWLELPGQPVKGFLDHLGRLGLR